MRAILATTASISLARLVDHVDRLVGQLAVMHVARRQLHCRLDRVIGVADVVVLFEIGLETHEDLDRIRHRRLVHVDLLEPARQRAVLLEMLAELLVGGGAHRAQLAALKRGLEQVRGIHCATRSRAGADHGVDLVDEEDRVGMLFKLLHDRLQALFEIAAIAGACEQRAHVERVDRGFRQDLRRFAPHDLECETFRDRGLAHAGIAHQERVVLAAAAQHLNATLHLVLAPDQRVDIALLGFDVEVDAVLFERAVLRVGLSGPFGLLLFLGAGHGTRFTELGIFRDTMGDEVHRVIARHVLLLQEIGGVALALGEDRDEHVRPGHFRAARALDMNRGALDHPLESGGRHGFGPFDLGHEGGEFVIDEFDQRCTQFIEIDGAGFHHARGIGLVDQCEEQMLERRQFVFSGVGERQCTVNGLFERIGKRRHELLLSCERWREGIPEPS